MFSFSSRFLFFGAFVVSIAFSAVGKDNDVRDVAVGDVVWRVRSVTNGLEVVSASQDSGRLVIPPDIDGVPIVSIAKDAFNGKAGLTDIEIPDSVEIIYNGAFANCTELLDVSIPSGVKRLGEWVPATNDWLVTTNWTTVTTNGGISTYFIPLETRCSDSRWGSGVFENCDSLTNVVMSYGLSAIGAKAFRGCIGLERISMPDSVTMIGAGAFSECRRLVSAKLSDNLEILGFAYGLVTVDGLDGRYCQMTTYTEVTQDGGQTTKVIPLMTCTSDELWDETEYFKATDRHCIYLKEFSSDGGLTTVAYPVPDLRWFEKYKNTALQVRKFDAQTFVSTIGSLQMDEETEALLNAVKETNISPDEQTFADQRLFYSSLSPSSDFSDDPSAVRDGVFYGCINLREIKLPGSLRRLASYTFYDCCRLTKINLPLGLQIMGRDVFGGESSLVDIETPWFQHGSLRDIFPTYAWVTNLVISSSPENLRFVGFDNWRENALAELSKRRFLGSEKKNEILREYLKELKKFRDGEIVSTDKEILSGFRSLKTLTLPESVIEFDSFLGLSNAVDMTRFKVHGKMHRLGSGAFAGSNIRNVVIDDSPPMIADYAFSNSRVTNVVFFGNAQDVSPNAFSPRDENDWEAYASEDLVLQVLQGSVGWSEWSDGLPSDGYWPEYGALYKCRKIHYLSQPLDLMGDYIYYDSSASCVRKLPQAWLSQNDLLLESDVGTVLLSSAEPISSRSLYASYVAGLDPRNETSKFTANITFVDGNPVVTWKPDLGSARVYKVLGKASLSETSWVYPVTDKHRFFSVSVEMPK